MSGLVLIGGLVFLRLVGVCVFFVQVPIQVEYAAAHARMTDLLDRVPIRNHGCFTLLCYQYMERFGTCDKHARIFAQKRLRRQNGFIVKEGPAFAVSDRLFAQPREVGHELLVAVGVERDLEQLVPAHGAHGKDQSAAKGAVLHNVAFCEGEASSCRGL